VTTKKQTKSGIRSALIKKLFMSQMNE